MDEAARLLETGGLVAVPTETVYGLAADALNEKAVARIFEAKGRPADNPLIVHIGDLSELRNLCRDVPEAAYTLALHFWPGPLTLVLPRRGVVPDLVCAGMSTVAVRMPAHPALLELLRATGLVLAAPSANLSGSPSPTTAQHVLYDLDGRVDAVVDGGPCEWGVESTVLDLTVSPPCVLRPGGITAGQLSVALSVKGIAASSGKGEQADAPRAPGMKYRHYAPRAPLHLLEGSIDEALRQLETAPRGARVLCCDEEKPLFAAYHPESYGREDDPRDLMRGLFAALRRLDESAAPALYARLPNVRDERYDAIVNRVTKAVSGK